jgi:hypothetical protein
MTRINIISHGAGGVEDEEYIGPHCENENTLIVGVERAERDGPNHK